MNKIFNNGIFHLLIGFLSIIGSIVLYSFEKKQSDFKLNPKLINDKIAFHEAELTKVLDTIEIMIKKKSVAFNNAENSVYFNQFNFKLNSNLIILIFRNDTLRYWTDNSVPVPTYINDSIFPTTRIINLKNGWYDKIEKSVDHHKILGLIRLKDNYYFDNQYLKSKFIIDNDIPPSFLMSNKPILIGENIISDKNEYLFSLIPSVIAENDKCSDFAVILFFLGLIFILIGLSKKIQGFSSNKFSYGLSALLVFSTIIIIYAVFRFEIPKYIFYSDLFQIDSVLENKIKLSPGVLLLFSLGIFFISYHIFKIFPIESISEKIISKNRLFGTILFTLYLSFISIIFFKINATIENRILNSEFDFNFVNILEINKYDIITHIAIAGLFASVIILADLFIKLFTRFSHFQNLLLPILFSVLICKFLIPTTFINPSILEISFLSTVLFIIATIRFNKKEYHYSAGILIIFVISIFSVFSARQLESEKLKSKMMTKIERLSNENDEMAERFLKEADVRLKNDTGLVSLLTNISINQDILVFDYLKRKYFYGFWEKYDLEIVICGNSEFYRIENQALNCEGYYRETFDKYGIKIKNTGFWFIQNNSGKITYTGIVEVDKNIDKRNLQLYMTLSEKLTSKSQGYPELLIDKSSLIKNEFENFSYAKYSNGLLAVKYGNFPYELTDKTFISKTKNGAFIEFDGEIHLIKILPGNRTIVLSQKKHTAFDILISAAYLLVLYNLLLFLTTFLNNRQFILSHIKFDFKNKIRFSMIGILVLSFIIFGSGTIYYTIEQNKRTNTNEMTEKVQSVLVELKHKLQDEKNLTPAWHSDKYDHLDELLIKFSEVFFSDINLYDLNGYLLATSRSEIFNRGLTGTQMNTGAFKKMAIHKNTEFIQKESIGNLEFSSIYVPLQNTDNKTIAFINLPYFTEKNNLQKNISNVLIAVINFYVLLFLLTVFLALIISTEITRPLRMLQNKLKSVQLGKKQQEIIYNKKDEIGELVKEYNLMIKKIESSAEKMAESERESAWREMAKQIAHEIKNPLTPMKLSIQLLQKTWFDKSGNQQEFEKRLNNVSETLIEQISTLSSIASEFSAFAKMPKTRNEEVEIAKKLTTVVKLFENTKNIEITLSLNNNEDLKIIADKEQVSRVFINLIKNAIQAIPHKQKGKIEIILERNKNKAKITVKDNGEGIPEDKKERLFEPSFTTKTTGMGIGLAIVKNIVESAGGNISFESSTGKGTSFFVEFLIP